MKSKCFKTPLLAVILCLWVPASGKAGDDTRRDATVQAVEIAMPSVVNISTETIVEVHDPFDNVFRDFFGRYWGRRPQQSLGSGVIFDEDGYILTNLHVVRRANRITVTFADGRVFEAKALVGTTKTDVALLKLVAPKDEKFKAIRFAKANDLLLGETVLALGNPFGLGGTVTKGILSSKARRPPSEEESLEVADWLQTDAAINPGNSGGPLVNLQGELIGLNVAIFKEGQGIGFAIPISRVTEALSDLFTPERVKGLWFGARAESTEAGLEIKDVTTESPAELAGLKPGDRIVRVNDNAPRSLIEFNHEMIATHERDAVRLTIDRDGSNQTLNVQLIPETAFFNEGLLLQKLGLHLTKVTPNIAAQLGNQSVEGLIVNSVEPDSSAEKAGFQEGFILRGINGQAVNDILEAAKLVHGKKPGEKVQLNLIVPRRVGLFLQLLRVDRDILVQ